MTDSCDYTSGERLLTVDHVSLTIRGHIILRDVSAKIDDIERTAGVTGQVVCFLGPSGIGKTSLSRIIAGQDQPTAGRVTVRNGVPVACGMVGMVSQTYPLFEFLTVRQNLLVAGRQAHASKHAINSTLDTLVGEFDLKQYLELYPRQLSGGTRQRVAIARQLMCSEHYLVLDEPFSGLDVIMKQRTCEVIQRVANMNTLNTIIIVTHDVTEGMSIADTVWLMGREHGLPGARIVREYDLAANGLCWRPDLTHDPQFLQLVSEVKAGFVQLLEPKAA